jgi:hypothetical protein
LILTAAVALAAGPGCIHVTVDGEGNVKSLTPATPGLADVPAAATAKSAGKGKADPQVKQASATFPMPALPKLPKLEMPKLELPRTPATTLVPLWQNRIAYLNDPSRGGAMGAGLVGQVFLFDANDQFVLADGNLTVELFDEGQKKPDGEPVKLGQWVFKKDALAKLATVDEHLGKCYALFLPWPSYKPEVNKIRLTVRYEPDNGTPLYAPPTSVAIDTSTPSGVSGRTGAAPLVSTGGFSGPMGAPMNPGGPHIPVGGSMPPPSVPSVPAGFAPTGSVAPVNPAAPPGGLPPIAITAGRR